MEDPVGILFSITRVGCEADAFGDALTEEEIRLVEGE